MHKLVRLLRSNWASVTPFPSYDTQHKCHIALELRYGLCELDRYVIKFQDIQAHSIQAQMDLACYKSTFKSHCSLNIYHVLNKTTELDDFNPYPISSYSSLQGQHRKVKRLALGHASGNSVQKLTSYYLSRCLLTAHGWSLGLMYRNLMPTAIH